MLPHWDAVILQTKQRGNVNIEVGVQVCDWNHHSVADYTFCQHGFTDLTLRSSSLVHTVSVRFSVVLLGLVRICLSDLY